MISNGEGCHYLAAKKNFLKVFLKRITSKYDCDFYDLNSLHSFTTKKK